MKAAKYIGKKLHINNYKTQEGNERNACIINKRNQVKIFLNR